MKKTLTVFLILIVSIANAQFADTTFQDAYFKQKVVIGEDTLHLLVKGVKFPDGSYQDYAVDTSFFLSKTNANILYAKKDSLLYDGANWIGYKDSLPTSDSITASYIYNDSDVDGSKVSDALNILDNSISGLDLNYADTAGYALNAPLDTLFIKYCSGCLLSSSWRETGDTLYIDTSKAVVELSNYVEKSDSNITYYSKYNLDSRLYMDDRHNTKIGLNAGESLVYSNSNYNTFVGFSAGRNTTESLKNVFIGRAAGYGNITGDNNIYIGEVAGADGSGSNNTYVGGQAGRVATGSSNVILGSEAAGNWQTTTKSNLNVAIGSQTLYNADTTSKNVIIGAYSAKNSDTVNSSVIIGYSAGYNANGDSNIFIGNYAGYNETGSNRLYIDNSATSSPLIYGKFDNDLVEINGELTVADDVKADSYIFNDSKTIQKDTIITIPETNFEDAATTPVRLIDSSNYSYNSFAIELETITAFLNFNSTAYPDNRDIVVYPGNYDGVTDFFKTQSGNSFATATADTIVYFNRTSDIVMYPNCSIYMTLNSDMSDNSGDSPIMLHIKYNIIIYEE